MSTRQEAQLRRAVEGTIQAIDLALEPSSPAPMNDADKCEILIPQLRAQLQSALDANEISDAHVVANLSARLADATTAEAADLQTVIDLYSAV